MCRLCSWSQRVVHSYVAHLMVCRPGDWRLYQYTVIIVWRFYTISRFTWFRAVCAQPSRMPLPFSTNLVLLSWSLKQWPIYSVSSVSTRDVSFVTTLIHLNVSIQPESVGAKGIKQTFWSFNCNLLCMPKPWLCTPPWRFLYSFVLAALEAQLLCAWPFCDDSFQMFQNFPPHCRQKAYC